ncbi:MAG: biopolymer transporter ExbD, partial [Nannocystaceae bacterium]|nr:biopolymer transporter ExbD [Nannocystaceae bacterium]
MSLGDRASGLRARRKSRGQGAVIDLTPLIDIVFQLLIFFLLTATFQTSPSFKVNLPKAENRESSQDPKAVVVSLSHEGNMEIEGKPVDV